MTRKHFVAIADALRGATPIGSVGTPADVLYARVAQHQADIKAVADALAASNGRFDRERFYRAAWYDAGIDDLLD